MEREKGKRGRVPPEQITGRPVNFLRSPQSPPIDMISKAVPSLPTPQGGCGQPRHAPWPQSTHLHPSAHRVSP